MLTPARRVFVMAAGLALLSACSSEPLTAPPAQVMAPSEDASASRLGDLRKKVLLEIATGVERKTPLDKHLTVSVVIGTKGGKLTIPEAGVTVYVPAGALTAPTEISMTARKGALLAYDFKPHGIVFAKPLVFEQNLKITNATFFSSLGLTLGYYSDPVLLTTKEATISEAIVGLTNLLHGTFSSNIYHFSGYLVASGRRPMMSPPPE